MKLNSDPRVKEVFDEYPKAAQQKLLQLRDLVLDAASEIDDMLELEETIKWGEPSYLTKNGSTVRMDWKAKKPNQYAIYFKCTSKLVPTFKAIYKNTFEFEGNRAIIFNFDAEIPVKELKHCLSLALQYHKLKNLPQLGA